MPTRIPTLLCSLALLAGACSPASAMPEPAAATPTATSSPAPAAASPSATAVAPTGTARAAPTSRGPNLEATDPLTVSLASGGIQLVEFFRFT